MNDVQERLSQILVTHFGVEPWMIIPATDFRADMAADSLDLLDLTLSVENEFDVEIPDDAAEEIHTVGDLITFLQAHPARTPPVGPV